VTATDRPAGEIGGAGRGRTAVAVFVAGLRQYARTPVLLAMLAVFPAYLIVAFSRLTPETTVPLSVPGDGTEIVALSELYAVVLTPMVGALVGGLAGLFLVRAARGADGRLVVAGASSRALVAARLALVAAVGILVAAVGVAAAATTYVPERPVVLFGATLLAAVNYGLLGALAALVVDRLAGVYLVLFGTMIDFFLLQNPLADDGDIARYLPGHAPTELAVDGGFSTAVSAAPALSGLAFTALLGAVTVLALGRSLRTS
jgi:hypothetical protein